MRVRYFIDRKKNKPVQDFISSLSSITQSQVIRVLTTIEKYGLEPVKNHTRKLINTPLWEIRILGKNSIRLFYAIKYKDELIILHGFVKKSQKTPPKELNIAIKRYTTYFYLGLDS